jgi:hypothetical protein
LKTPSEGFAAMFNNAQEDVQEDGRHESMIFQMTEVFPTWKYAERATGIGL